MDQTTPTTQANQTTRYTQYGNRSTLPLQPGSLSAIAAENKAFIQDYAERLWNKRELRIINDVFADDAEIHSPFNIKLGRYTMTEIADKWLTAFPDLTLYWDDYIAEGDRVVSRWHAKGTHLGSFFSTAPTHHEVDYCGITIYQVVNQRVIRYWALVDVHAILRQLEHCESIAEAVE